MNSAVSIHTHFLEEALKGSIDLHIMKVPGVSMKSLETELISKGYSSMQNKLKHYLLQRQAENRGEKNENAVPELSRQETCHIIGQIKNLCVARTGAQEYSPVSDAVERHISYCFEETERKTVYFYPRQENGTGDLMPAAFAQVSKELYGSKAYTDTQRRKLNTLLTQKARKHAGTRQELIQAAYRLGMNLHETNTFLTKAAFTYALDYFDPWELKAAYLIACHPVEENDSPMVFRSKMNTAVPTESFLQQIYRSEFIRWVKEYRRQRDLGKKEDFLLEWAWKLMVDAEPIYAQKSFYTKQSIAQEQKVNDAFSAHFAHLEELAAQIDSSAIIPATDLSVTECMMDRRHHLLELIYAAGNPDLYSVSLCCAKKQLYYSPAFKEYGFTKLDRNLQKIADPDRPLSRSDIITLGMELGMTWEQLDRALETGGFYKLYVKDIHEQALVAALEAGSVDLEQAVLDQLQQRYDTLSDKLRKNLIKNEPEWVRRVKDAVSTSRTDH